MNITTIEATLKEWLTREGIAVAIVQGQDIAELPQGEQCVIVGCQSVDNVVGPLRRAQSVIVVSTPFTVGLSAHRDLVETVDGLIEDFDTGELADSMNDIANARLAGLYIKDQDNAEEGNRWHTSLPFMMGVDKTVV
jgi:hypothetical protein